MYTIIIVASRDMLAPFLLPFALYTTPNALELLRNIFAIHCQADSQKNGRKTLRHSNIVLHISKWRKITLTSI